MKEGRSRSGRPSFLFCPHAPYTNARNCAMIGLSSRFAANNRQSIEVLYNV